MPMEASPAGSVVSGSLSRTAKSASMPGARAPTACSRCRARAADAGFDTRVVGSRDPEAIADAARDAVSLIVGYAQVDAALLDRLPGLRMLATMSAGFDMIDTVEARRRGLWVSNLPHAATEDVAVHALASALSLVRALPQADATVRGGGWNTEFAELPCRAGELTLGLLGFGRIARVLARIAAPVFGRVAAYDPHADEAGSRCTPR